MAGDGGRRARPRSALFVLALAWGRVRRRSSGALLAASGIAVGTAVLVGVFAGTRVAQDRSASQAVERIPAASRSVRAVWFGVPVGPPQRYPEIDATVRKTLGDPGLPGPTSIVLFRESTVAGHFVSLAGVDGLARYVRLTSGRLPSRCTAERCEVLRLRGRGALPSAPGLRLVQVGTGTLRSSALFGDFLAPTDNALADREVAPALQQGASYHRPQPAPLVVAEGFEPLTRAPSLANTYRSYAWVWPLSAGRPRLWEIDDLVSRSERARSALTAHGIGYSVQAPVEELRVSRARRDGRRSPPAARRRRGGGAPLRIRGAGRSRHPARSRSRASSPHVVRSAPLAAAVAHRRRERVRRTPRHLRRPTRRPRGRRSLRFQSRGAVVGGPPRECAERLRARAGGWGDGAGHRRHRRRDLDARA